VEIHKKGEEGWRTLPDQKTSTKMVEKKGLK
jgi:hypothetical protein